MALPGYQLGSQCYHQIAERGGIICFGLKFQRVESFGHLRRNECGGIQPRTIERGCAVISSQFLPLPSSVPCASLARECRLLHQYYIFLSVNPLETFSHTQTAVSHQLTCMETQAGKYQPSHQGSRSKINGLRK